MDDEDLNSKKHFSNDTVEAEKALMGVVTSMFDGLEWDEKPIYFENEEEAEALLEQHFSDGRIPKVNRHRKSPISFIQKLTECNK